MNEDFSMLELDELRKLHKVETDALNTTLLNGAAWEEVQEQRHRVTLIEMEIDKKQLAQQASDSPAPNEQLAQSLRQSLLTRFI
jgi:predicted nucleic acid-binding Zn ribbon protein